MQLNSDFAKLRMDGDGNIALLPGRTAQMGKVRTAASQCPSPNPSILSCPPPFPSSHTAHHLSCAPIAMIHSDLHMPTPQLIFENAEGTRQWTVQPRNKTGNTDVFDTLVFTAGNATNVYKQVTFSSTESGSVVIAKEVRSPDECDPSLLGALHMHCNIPAVSPPPLPKLQITLKDENPAITYENAIGDQKWVLQPRRVNPADRLDDPNALSQGFTNLVITSTDNARMTRQATLTSSSLGGQLTLNQVQGHCKIQSIVADLLPAVVTSS